MLLHLTDLQWLPEGGCKDPTRFAPGATMHKEGKKKKRKALGGQLRKGKQSRQQ